MPKNCFRCHELAVLCPAPHPQSVALEPWPATQLLEEEPLSRAADKWSEAHFRDCGRVEAGKAAKTEQDLAVRLKVGVLGDLARRGSANTIL